MLKIEDKVRVKSEAKIREEFFAKEYEIRYNVVTVSGNSKEMVDVFNKDMFRFCNKLVTLENITYLASYIIELEKMVEKIHGQK